MEKEKHLGALEVGAIASARFGTKIRFKKMCEATSRQGHVTVIGVKKERESGV